MEKKDLLANIRDYSPKEIAAAIEAGVVTFYELQSSTHGQFTPLLQRKVRLIIENGELPVTDETQPFQPVNSGSVEQPVSSQSVNSGSVEQQEPFQPVNSGPVEQPGPFQPVNQNSVNSGSTPDPASQTRVEDTPPVQVPTSSSIGQQNRLIPCPECGNMVSPLATQCPLCGVPFNMICCPECGTWVSSYASECPTCGMPFHDAQPNFASGYQQDQPQINQPFPGNADLTNDLDTPPNFQSFNWGGFVFGWLWGICNGVYWSLVNLLLFFLIFIPPAVAADEDEGIAVSAIFVLAKLAIKIVLGILGDKMSWKSKRFNSVERFVYIQKAWRTAALIFFGILMGILLIFIIAILASL